MNQQIANEAFQLFEKISKGQKLPCEFAPAREFSVDEFMYMGSGVNSKEEIVHSFKHRDTRNYLDVVNNKLAIRPVVGKLAVYFDNFPFDDADFDKRTEYAESVKHLDRMPMEVCVEVRFQTSVTVDAPAIDGKCQFDSADKVARWAIKDKYHYLGPVEVVITDYNH